MVVADVGDIRERGLMNNRYKIRLVYNLYRSLYAFHLGKIYSTVLW